VYTPQIRLSEQEIRNIFIKTITEKHMEMKTEAKMKVGIKIYRTRLKTTEFRNPRRNPKFNLLHKMRRRHLWPTY
jgi:hypothetical protein